mmetsp:Transcript_14562/g.35141  ORF Transcript_14562/g.35141 Transcript_14562/m.35141 type:complete len:223 (+) Transcript_14562:165-833(+)
MRATTSSTIAGSIATTSESPSPHSRGDCVSTSPSMPGPAARTDAPPPPRSPPLLLPLPLPLAPPGDPSMQLRRWTWVTAKRSSLTVALNASGNLAWVPRLQARGGPTCHRCTHCPSVVAEYRNSPSALRASKLGSRRWWPELPGHVECACSAATCAPLDAECTQMDPSLWARNSSVPPPPAVRLEQSMKRLHAATPSSRYLRTSRPVPASTSSIRRGLSGSA